MNLWKQALERGDAEVLADAIVQQREIPKALRWRLELPPEPER